MLFDSLKLLFVPVRYGCFVCPNYCSIFLRSHLPFALSFDKQHSGFVHFVIPNASHLLCASPPGGPFRLHPLASNAAPPDVSPVFIIATSIAHFRCDVSHLTHIHARIQTMPNEMSRKGRNGRRMRMQGKMVFVNRYPISQSQVNEFPDIFKSVK